LRSTWFHSQFYSEVLVAQNLVFWVEFCRSLFCLSVLFLLSIVLSVFRFTDSFFASLYCLPMLVLLWLLASRSSLYSIIFLNFGLCVRMPLKPITNYTTLFHLICYQFDDLKIQKGVTRRRKSKMNRQYNGQGH